MARICAASVIGEGGNLGMTQRGRIEAALNGVLLNTDFIDNSAGVDTSDHEVNIKILLNDAVKRGELTYDSRNELLRSMTDEVERARAVRQLPPERCDQPDGAHVGCTPWLQAAFHSHARSQGLLDRQIEFLPSDAEFAERKTAQARA